MDISNNSVILVLSFFICFSSVASLKPLMRIYNTDENFIIETSTGYPSISKYYDDTNTVASFCVTGTWISYSVSNYTTLGGVGGLTFSTENNICQGRMWPPMASFRPVGDRDNIYRLSLTTYALDGYRDTNFLDESFEPAVIYLMEGNITKPFVSFMVTGNFPITMYTEYNLGGKSVCIDAPQNGLAGGMRNINSITNYLGQEIKSFRFGCSSSDGSQQHFQLERNWKE